MGVLKFEIVKFLKKKVALMKQKAKKIAKMQRVVTNVTFFFIFF